MFRLLENAKRSVALTAAAATLAVLVSGAAGAGSTTLSFAASGATDGRISAVADFNGDGKLDLAVLRPGRIIEGVNGKLVVKSAEITVLLGDGAGGFRVTPGRSVETGGLTGAVTTGDFDGDGKADLAIANHVQDTGNGDVGTNNVRVLLGNGAGGFTASPPYPLKSAHPDGLTAADVNGDSKQDLVVPVVHGHVEVLLGDGEGRFAPAPGSAVTGGPALAVGDVNRDGKPDLVVTQGTNTIATLLGDGAGSFRPAGSQIAVGKYREAIAIEDFNRDGRNDIAVLSDDSTRILLGNGAGGFRPAPGSPVKLGGAEFAIADFNGDHKLDLLLFSEKLNVVLGNGKGGFRRAAAVADIASVGRIVAAADVNGDGRPDLAGENELLFQTVTGPRTARSRALPRRLEKNFSTRGTIVHLAADRKQVAVTTSEGDCGKIVVWTSPGEKPRNLDAKICRYHDCDCGSELALGGGQIAWIDIAGGNDLELRMLVARLSGGAPKELAHEVSSPSGDGGWVGNVLGGGTLVAFNRWRVDCGPAADIYGCDWGETETSKAVVRIAAGRRVVVAHAPLRAVGGERMAVESVGAISVLRPNGSRVATVPVSAVPPRAVALSSAHLALQNPLTLDLYNPLTGKKGKSLRLGPAAALELSGVNAKLALLRSPGAVVLVRLSDGKLISLPLQRVADAKLTEAGLFYAYNTPKVAMKGHVVFEPTAKLLSRF
jgi:hypothetical protein